MPSDIFISYAHQGDNISREAVSAFVAQLHCELELDFRHRFDRDIDIFFDKEDIQDFEHWKVRCHRALRESRFFIACLSKSYLNSHACRWEYEEWCKHEIEHGLAGQGAASLWFVCVEDLVTPEDDEAVKRWRGDLVQRFHIQCHEWPQRGSDAFIDAAARAELIRLTEYVAKRLHNLVIERALRGNLPWANANFVGRERELADLRRALTNCVGLKTAGIHGVGGMGKTALALAFAQAEADAFPGGCWLLRCEGYDSLLSVFRSIVPDFEIELADHERGDDWLAVRRMFDVLRLRGTTLFLLDNVDRECLLASDQFGFLRDETWVCLLYTTRLAPSEFQEGVDSAALIDLDRLPDAQSVNLIQLYQPDQAFASPEHETAAREIVRLLDGLTLAIETAAVYLGQCDPRNADPQHAVDIPSYLVSLRNDLSTGGGEGVMSQVKEISATIRPTLSRLDAPSRTVLQLAALLPPDTIVLPWLRTVAGKQHPELLTDAQIGQSDAWTLLVRSLVGMRLFQTGPTEPGVVTTNHVLHRALEVELRDDRSRLQDRLRNHVHSRGDLLWQAWPDASVRWEAGPLTECVRQWIEWDGSVLAMLPRSLESVDLLNLTAVILLWRIGHPHEAESLLRLSISIQATLGLRALDTITSVNALAGSLIEQGFAEEAAKWLVDLIDSVDPSHVSLDSRLAALWQNLGNAWLNMRNLTGAESAIRRAIKIWEDRPVESAELGGCLLTLAAVVRANGLPDRALPIYVEGLRVLEASRGHNHPETWSARTNLAVVLRELGFPQMSLSITRESIASTIGNMGSGHQNVGKQLLNQALLEEEFGEYEDAETHYIDALRILETEVGKEDAAVATVAGNLAILLEGQGKYEEAEQLHNRALRILEQTAGEESYPVACQLNNHAKMLEDIGRLSDAKILMERALAILRKLLGSSHPDSLSAQNNLAQIRRALDSGSANR